MWRSLDITCVKTFRHGRWYRDSFVRDLTHSLVFSHGTYVPWLLCKWHNSLFRVHRHSLCRLRQIWMCSDSFECAMTPLNVPWLIRMCYDSFICAFWRVIHVCHDSFKCAMTPSNVPWLLQMCHDSFIHAFWRLIYACVPWLVYTFVSWLIHACLLTTSAYVPCPVHMPVPWLIYTRILITLSYVPPWLVHIDSCLHSFWWLIHM